MCTVAYNWCPELYKCNQKSMWNGPHPSTMQSHDCDLPESPWVGVAMVDNPSKPASPRRRLPSQIVQLWVRCCEHELRKERINFAPWAPPYWDRVQLSPWKALESRSSRCITVSTLVALSKTAWKATRVSKVACLQGSKAKRVTLGPKSTDVENIVQISPQLSELCSE